MRPSPRPLAFVAASVVVHAVIGWLAVAGIPRLDPRPSVTTPSLHPSLIGETFEVPTEDILDPPATVAAGSTGEPSPVEPSDAVEEPREKGAAPARPVPARARVTRSARPADSAGAEGSSGAPALFGAVGDRASAPLAAAFTHGFPQAASADPRWLDAPFGSAGSADVTLVLDEAGNLVDAHTSGHPGPALAEGLRRTLALIHARSFVAEGRVTTLRVTANVTPDQVHDGLHGDVFAIGGSFDGGAGNAFFALAVGRRIDIRIRVVK